MVKATRNLTKVLQMSIQQVVVTLVSLLWSYSLVY